MKNKIYFIGILMLLASTLAYGQQDPMFTQYMTNPVSINPSIAGSRPIDNISMVYRGQWVGVEGAPTTIALTYSGLYKDKNVGLGSSLIHDRIGPVEQTGLYFDYAYHFNVDEQKKLAFGLMGGFNYYQFNLLNLRVIDQNDEDIPIDAEQHKFLPNFGVGMFYYTPKYFFGLSMPKLLRNSLSSKDNTLTIEDRGERHLFAMTGYTFILDENFKFKPSLIGRVVNGAPASLDLNATFVLKDKIWLGAMYRLGVSWGALIRWQMNDQIHIGYSFDGSTSRFRGYNYGTHEIFISYDLKKPDLQGVFDRFF